MAKVPPITVPLQFALVRYRVALECLNAPKTSLSPERALEILSARDELQDVLKTTERVPVDILSQVMQLDFCLKQKAGRILKVLNLPECRESLPAPSQDWWWHLDAKQVNWLIRGLTVIAWTGSLGLLANIASRFLSGGVGVLGAAAVVFPSFLTLLQARSELTDAGREGFDKLIAKLGIPQNSIKGDVTLKRSQWNGYQKANMGDLLNPSDQLQLSAGASATVMCNNLRECL